MVGSVPSGVTPVTSYALDAAGGSGTAQLYDSVAATWKGGGADTADFTSGYLVADSNTDRAYVPGSEFYYTTSFTIYFEFQVSSLSDTNLNAIYYAGTGDAIYFKPYALAGNGRFYFQANYGTTVNAQFSNTGLSINTWHSVYAQVDVSGQDLHVYIDGSLAGELIDSASIVDQVALAGNMYAGYVASGTNIVRVRNLKTYTGLVSP